MKTESVLDIPQMDLDPKVWSRNENTKAYELTEEANSKLLSIVEWVSKHEQLNKYLNNFSVRIIGSITTNQYTESSDIDLHFVSPSIPKDDPEGLNKVVRGIFDQEYKTQFGDDSWHINQHPIDIYFQVNPFQDLMSVGCYDIIKKEWIVGPDIRAYDDDPYSEYYADDMKYITPIIDDIRSVILECYEISMVIMNSIDIEFIKYEYTQLEDKIAKAANIFNSARECRKVYSAPQSEEQAKTFRTSKKWKVADSAFKLLDKFGYLAVLKELTVCWQQYDAEEIQIDQVPERVINIIQKSFSHSNELTEDMKDILNESNWKNKATIASLIAMLFCSGVVNASKLQRDISKLPPEQVNIYNTQVKDAIIDSASSEKISGLSYPLLVNLIATVLYNEGNLDYVRSKGNKDCIVAVANTIQNRAANQKEHFAEEIVRPSQYFGAKHVRGGIKDEDYIMYHPGFGYNKKSWDLCNQVAVDMIEDKLPNIIGNRNMIANKEIDNAQSYDAWGKNCDMKVGGDKTKNVFGYRPEHDGYKKYGKINPNTQQPNKSVSSKIVSPKKYRIQKGDTLYKIAKRFKISEKEILRKNPNLKNANKIKIGQEINI